MRGKVEMLKGEEGKRKQYRHPTSRPIPAVHPVLWPRLTSVALTPHQSGILLQKTDTITEVYNCSKCGEEATM